MDGLTLWLRQSADDGAATLLTGREYGLGTTAALRIAACTFAIINAVK